jgi:hypothetical protein
MMPESAKVTTQSSDRWLASKVIRTPIYNFANQKVGSVADLHLDNKGMPIRCHPSWGILSGLVNSRTRSSNPKSDLGHDNCGPGYRARMFVSCADNVSEVHQRAAPRNVHAASEAIVALFARYLLKSESLL